MYCEKSGKVTQCESSPFYPMIIIGILSAMFVIVCASLTCFVQKYFKGRRLNRLLIEMQEMD